MKSTIKIGVPDNIIFKILLFFKTSNLFNQYNPVLKTSESYKILEDLFYTDHFDLLITHPGFLYDSFKKNYTDILILNFLSCSVFFPFLKNRFNLSKSHNTIKAGIPQNSIFFKHLVKAIIKFKKINTKKIKYIEHLEKDTQFLFSENFLDLSIITEPYSYYLIKKNIASISQFSSIKKIPHLALFIKFSTFDKNKEFFTGFLDELKIAFDKFLSNKNMLNDFLKLFNDEVKDFVEIFVFNLKNNLLFSLPISDIDLSFITFDNPVLTRHILKLISQDEYIKIKQNITTPSCDKDDEITKKLFEFMYKFKKIPEWIFDCKKKLILDSYNLLVYKFNINQLKLKNQEKLISVLKSDLEHLKNNLYNAFVQLKDTSDRLIIQKIKVEEANKAKTRFFASITHDLKTPLTSILSITELLMEKETDPEKIKKLKVIYNSGNTLLNLINDLLTISKGDEGKLKIINKVFSFKEILNEIYESINTKLAKKDVKLIFEIDPEIPEILIGDPLKIKQILFNLLGNSTKFTEKGLIKLTIKIKEETDNDLILDFIIYDTGKGIKKEKLKTIFEPFEQENSEIFEKFGGTGLGLAIVKQLVELMEGKIECNSEEGKFTEFKFYIKLSKVVSKNSEKDFDIFNNLNNKVYVFQPTNLLIVEDNTVNRMIIKEYLNITRNLNIDFAENGEDALNKFKQKNYDLIMTDLQMPKMSGKELCRILREKNFNNPIIALTAFENESLEKLKESGFTDIIKKPYTRKKLIEILSKYVNLIEVKDKTSIKKMDSDKEINQNQPNLIVQENTKSNNNKSEISSQKQNVKFEFSPDKYLQKLNQNQKITQISKIYYKSLIDYYKNFLKSISNKNFDYENLRFIAHNLKGTSAIANEEEFEKLGKNLSKAIKEKNNNEILNLFNEYLEKLNYLIENKF